MDRRSVSGVLSRWAGWCALAAVSLALVVGCATPVKEMMASPPSKTGGEMILRAAAIENEDPYAAGWAAANRLKRQMEGVRPHVVIVAECFEDRARKERALRGVCSVFPRAIVFGGATYGSFTQAGCGVENSIAVLGIGGEGISVSAALERPLGVAGLTLDKDRAEIDQRLRGAGARLAGKLRRTPKDRLLVVIADAHSPKNAPLVEGVQEAVGKDFPITGGAVNKNAGQTFVYFQGRMFEDSAIALMLSGDFKVSLAGRQAKENKKVIATAKEAAAEALKGLKAKPFAALAFDCAGRKGKLDKIEDELAAMQEAIGKDLPLFGCYCAGEIGPADRALKKAGVLSSGVGWHVMFTIVGR